MGSADSFLSQAALFDFLLNQADASPASVEYSDAGAGSTPAPTADSDESIVSIIRRLGSRGKRPFCSFLRSFIATKSIYNANVICFTDWPFCLTMEESDESK